MALTGVQQEVLRRVATGWQGTVYPPAVLSLDALFRRGLVTVDEAGNWVVTAKGRRRAERSDDRPILVSDISS